MILPDGYLASITTLSLLRRNINYAKPYFHTMRLLLPFMKFDGAGNDFILINSSNLPHELSQQQVATLCHRRFGIGADGLMTLQHGGAGVDFIMRYYNSDGKEASMCGNGGRCIAIFAHMQGLGRKDPETQHKTLHFVGPDGTHDAEVVVWNEDAGMGIVKLGMRSVARSEIRRIAREHPRCPVPLDGWFLDTGSPHFVQRVVDLDHYDVVSVGRAIRLLDDLFPGGTNVDFIEDNDDGTLAVRTYERGVEDETYACGTGVTACALISGNQRLRTRGGDFRVTFSPSDDAYADICLTGPVAFNFKGEVPLEFSDSEQS